MWDVVKAVAHLNQHANDNSLGLCAQYVREAVEAGGLHLARHPSAKDYGSSLEQAGFNALPSSTSLYIAGDVAIIQPIVGHPHGHMTMFNGTIWVSDFRQMHGMYPGPTYRKLRPPFVVFRSFVVLVAPPDVLVDHTTAFV